VKMFCSIGSGGGGGGDGKNGRSTLNLLP
jgi:hypothetical protein